MSDIRPFAFVLMPFDKAFEDLYKFGIKQVADAVGIVAERVDEQHFSESILERIYRQIDAADLIISEMTGNNPNVYYELGFAHAKSKPCILLTQKADGIPFDLKHHPHVIYDGTVADIAEKIRPKLIWLKDEVEKKKTKSISLMLENWSGNLEKTDYSIDGSVDFRLTLRNSTDDRSPEIDAIYIKTRKEWSIYSNESECPNEVVGESGEYRRHLITSPIRRLAPGAFSQVKFEARRRFWSKFSGSEKLEQYIAKGTLHCEVVTAEGSFPYEFSLNVSFDELPF